MRKALTLLASVLLGLLVTTVINMQRMGGVPPPVPRVDVAVDEQGAVAHLVEAVKVPTVSTEDRAIDRSASSLSTSCCGGCTRSCTQGSPPRLWET